jgi:hypothetical protein
MAMVVALGATKILPVRPNLLAGPFGMSAFACVPKFSLCATKSAFRKIYQCSVRFSSFPKNGTIKIMHIWC